jgi:hypothetical protein
MSERDLNEKFVVHFSYPVVDAAVEYLLSALEQVDPQRVGGKMAHRRQQLTNGSSIYFQAMSEEDKRLEMIGIMLRDVGDGLTYFHIEALHDLRHRDNAAQLIKSMRLWIHMCLTDQARDMRALANAPLPDFSDITTEDIASQLAQRSAEVELKPPIPEIDGWDSVFDWEKQFAKRAGITTDAELARQIHKSPKTVRNRRSELNRTKRPHKK